MALYNINVDSLSPLEQTSFQAEGIRERSDLQRLLKMSIDVIDDSLMVLTEEYGNWEDSRRRIDLLCIDQDANLVVIEIKRTEDGGHMELQAIRYAAMVSSMTFVNAVEAHSSYLKSNGQSADEAEADILRFLDWEEPDEDGFANDVRIILVSAEFSKEITSSVLWLNERDLDIRCMRIKPYRHGHDLFLDINQIVPLPEASDYQTRIKEKAIEKRKLSNFNPDFTKYDLKIDGVVYDKLPKRRLIFEVVKACIAAGATPDEISIDMPSAGTRWLIVDGEVSADVFADLASKIKNSRGTYKELRRYYVDAADLFHHRGKTYALTNQWGAKAPPTARVLVEKWLPGRAEIKESQEG